MYKSSILLLAVLALLAAACSSSDASEQIEGTWYWAAPAVYVEYADDGTFSVSPYPDLSNPIESGTYTFDGETLTVVDDPDSMTCADTTATWTVEFSDDGDEASTTIVEDTCSGSVRGQNGVWLRQTT